MIGKQIDDWGIAFKRAVKMRYNEDCRKLQITIASYLEDCHFEDDIIKEVKNFLKDNHTREEFQKMYSKMIRIQNPEMKVNWKTYWKKLEGVAIR